MADEDWKDLIRTGAGQIWKGAQSEWRGLSVYMRAAIIITLMASSVGMGPFPHVPNLLMTANDGGIAAQPAESPIVTEGSPEEQPEFNYVLQAVENCESDGEYCRNVTVGLTNTGNATARNVYVRVKLVTQTITSGNATIYQEGRELGEVSPAETVSESAKIKIGARDAVNIKQDGCTVAAWVSIQSERVSDTSWVAQRELDCSIL